MDGFCTSCNAQIKSFDGLSACPTCGTANTPCAFENQFTISINHQELRILIIWAENFVQSLKELDQHRAAKTLNAILNRINKQLPTNKQVMSLSNEINDLKKMLGPDNVQTNFVNLDDEKSDPPA